MGWLCVNCNQQVPCWWELVHFFGENSYINSPCLGSVLSKTWMAFCKRLWAKRGRHFLAYYVVEKYMAEGQVVWWKICRVFATRLNAFENGDYYYKDSFYFTILSGAQAAKSESNGFYIQSQKRLHYSLTHNSPLCLVKKGSRLSEILQQFQC